MTYTDSSRGTQATLKEHMQLAKEHTDIRRRMRTTAEETTDKQSVENNCQWKNTRRQRVSQVQNQQPNSWQEDGDVDQAREEDHARINPWSCWAEKTWPAAGSVCGADR